MKRAITLLAVALSIGLSQAEATQVKEPVQRRTHRVIVQQLQPAQAMPKIMKLDQQSISNIFKAKPLRGG